MDAREKEGQLQVLFPTILEVGLYRAMSKDIESFMRQLAFPQLPRVDDSHHPGDTRRHKASWDDVDDHTRQDLEERKTR